MKLGNTFKLSFMLLIDLFPQAGLARADNPIIQNIYTADPAPVA
jgi:hypothetical protein